MEPRARGLDELLHVLAHPVRRCVLERLAERPMGYTELMRACGVGDSGTFGFHLRRLEGLVEKREDSYKLTPLGEAVLGALRGLSEALGAKAFEKGSGGGLGVEEAAEGPVLLVDVEACRLTVKPWEGATLKVDVEGPPEADAGLERFEGGIHAYCEGAGGDTRGSLLVPKRFTPRTVVVNAEAATVEASGLKAGELRAALETSTATLEATLGSGTGGPKAGFSLEASSLLASLELAPWSGEAVLELDMDASTAVIDVRAPADARVRVEGGPETPSSSIIAVEAGGARLGPGEAEEGYEHAHRRLLIRISADASTARIRVARGSV